MGEGRFMESEHLQNSDVSWGHEPGLRKSLDCRQTTFRFMESLHDFSVAHWDREPPLTRPSATLSPSDGERDGVRGRFMESEHLQNSDVSWGHEPGLRKSLDCRQ